MGARWLIPWLLLSKVEAVNDTLNGRPLLVVHTPFQSAEESVDVFDPVVDGQRLTMGLSGHFQRPGPRPLLYDRETESLWVVRDHQMSCVAGTFKGKTLRRLQRCEPMSWSDWVDKHQESRLIVGAYRNPPPAPVNIQ